MDEIKCEECGKRIKNVFWWEGRKLGIECWKKVAIPVLDAERKEREEKRFKAWMAKCQMVAQVLKEKDLSKITNEFKLSFIPSIIAQVEAGRPLSGRQIEIAQSFFNGKDHLRAMVLWCIVDGEADTIEMIDYNHQHFGKLIKMAKEIMGSEYPEQKPFYRYMDKE